MKILLTNYRYFISGGPERYLFNIQKQLSLKGHQVIPFSIDYAKNNPSPCSKYFVTPIGDREHVYFDQHGKSPGTFLKTISRLFYSSEIEHATNRIVEATTPDLAYVLHYLRKLSPSLLVGLKKKDLPVIVRLSDYMMLCPQAHFLRKCTPCTECISNKLLPSLRYKCVKDSTMASFLNLLATWYHRQKHYFDLIDTFVCTNQFMYNMMLEAGYPKNRLSCIPTFTDIDRFLPCKSKEKEDYFIFVGRIIGIKGVHVLLEAMGRMTSSNLQSTHLKIVGKCDADYLVQCKNIVSAHKLSDNVKFLGEVSTEVLPSLLSRALFSVVPSLCFENLPNTLLESYSCGTPVLASDIGSLSDCVDSGTTGYLFEPGNAEDLASKLEHCLAHPALLESMGIASRKEAEKKYSPKQHVTSLTKLFNRFT